MDTVEAVTTAKRVIYRLLKPSQATWLVAHNGKNQAHVLEVGPEQECLCGLGVLEKCLDRQAAEDRARTFGWVAPPDDLTAKER